MSAMESWSELPGGEIEFTMKRLRSADWAYFPSSLRTASAELRTL